MTKKGEARQQFTFDIVTPSNLKLEDDPVTNKEGSVTGGRVTHKGAITFLNTKNGKKVAVGDFVVNFKKGKVFATSVNGDAVDPLAVFTLDVIDPPLYPVYDDELGADDGQGLRSEPAHDGQGCGHAQRGSSRPTSSRRT